MTNFTMNLMVAAATAVVAAGTATAQTMKAEVPFAFRVGTAVMAAGSYNIAAMNSRTGFSSYHVYNTGTQKGVVAMPTGATDANKKWQERGKSVLAFECASSGCSLVGVWNQTGGPEYTFSRPKLDKNETARLVVIDLQNGKAD